MPVHVIAWLLCCYTVTRSLATTSFPIPPSGHHLLLQHSPVAVALPPVARRQMEVMPSATEREPSCSELRSMWRHMRRMGRQMEFTNEIPKMQDPFMASAMRYGGVRRRPSKYPDPNPYSSAKSSSKELVFQKADFSGSPNKGQFGEIVRNSNQLYDSSPNTVLDNGVPLGFSKFDDYPGSKFIGSSAHVPGRFADTPLPEASLGSYGTVVHTPEERARFRALTRRPPEFRRYRTRWGDSTGLGRIPFRPSKPTTDQYHYGSVVTHGERHPFGGFAEFPQEVGQRTGASARVERIDKIPLAGKLKWLLTSE
ncbi:uncharacterized protein LOC129226829 [Uloborus diversus]|uniref:uncharacterized protein LOC129226829 n=1 Tax=Uloborus diversus TaxID=327109 RepID=UPI00240988B2|nr:uncharacterized protein LOC129226829 [Uloborus diversus]